MCTYARINIYKQREMHGQRAELPTIHPTPMAL